MAATIGARHCVGAFAELERCGRESDLSVAQQQMIEIARAGLEIDFRP